MDHDRHEPPAGGVGVPPEPAEDDIDLAIAAQVRLGDTNLRPAEDDSCADCRYYLTPTDPIAFCWHPTQRSLVGAGWVCTAFCTDPDR